MTLGPFRGRTKRQLFFVVVVVIVVVFSDS